MDELPTQTPMMDIEKDGNGTERADNMTNKPAELSQVLQVPLIDQKTKEDLNTDDIEKRTFKYKVLMQLCITNAYVALGAFAEFVGPTLQDLMEMLGVSYESIAKGLAVRASALAIGAIVGVMMRNFIKSKPAVLVISGLLIAALGIILIPFSSSLLMFSIVMFLPGFGEGILGLGVVEYTMKIWGEKSAGPMQSLYFAFDLGAVLMTESVRPFLSPDMNHQTEMIANTTAFHIMHNSSTISVNQTMNTTSTRLMYPFIIVAAYTVVAALLMAVFYCSDKTASGSQEARTSCTPLPLWKECNMVHIRIVVITLCASMFCFHANGGEESFVTYLFSYAVDSARFTKYQSTSLMTVVRLSLLVGRFSGMFIAHYVKIQYMMATSLVMLIAAYSCMSLFVGEAIFVLWLLSVIAGMFTSILYAAGMSWGNLYVETNAFVTLIWLMGASLGSLSYGYLTGAIFDKYGVESFPFLMLGYAVSLLLLLIFMQIVASFHQPRFDANNVGNDSGSDDTEVDKEA